MSSPPDSVDRSARRAGKKRKRRTSSSKATQSSEPTGTFLSQSSHRAAQLELAGASETDLDPTLTIPNFPHRGFGRRGGSSEPEEEQQEETVEVQGNARRGNPRPREANRKGHLDVLLRSIEQFLDRGDVGKAARAYGLVLQLRPRSLPIDVRSYNLWATGAEILMREGEEQRRQKEAPANGVGDGDIHGRRGIRRWGSAANMGRVRAYFEALVRQFPFDRRDPDLISAVDFWLALLSCEIYNTHADYVLGLASLDNDNKHDDDDDDGVYGAVEADESQHDFPPYYDGDSAEESFHREGTYFGHLGDIRSYPSPKKKSALPDPKDNIRQVALESMRDIIQRLEKLMEDAPYTKNEHYLRLRATASLFAADLCMPTSPATPAQLREAGTRRTLEQRAALHAIQELRSQRMDNPTPVAEAHLEAYYLKEEHLLRRPANLYSSLPIREGL